MTFYQYIDFCFEKNTKYDIFIVQKGDLTNEMYLLWL